MLCDVCKQREATTYIKAVRNGKLYQQHLCSHCVQEMGLGSVQGSLGLGDLLGGLFQDSTPKVPEKICETCGTSFADISKSGKIGCAACYQTFAQELAPMIQRIHGTTSHKGKRPGGYALRVTPRQTAEMMPVQDSPLQEKQRLLQKAVQAQEFEQAARLRDEIKELMGDD